MGSDTAGFMAGPVSFQNAFLSNALSIEQQYFIEGLDVTTLED